jgi:hypothetical protein
MSNEKVRNKEIGNIEVTITSSKNENTIEIWGR